MKLEEMLDIFDIDEIEKMSPEECKGLLKGFFIGAGFIKAIDDGISKAVENRYKEKKTRSGYKYTPYTSVAQDLQDFRRIQLIFDSREDAEAVLYDLREMLEESDKNYVLVMDLYSLAGLPVNTAMYKWVWHNLEDCKIERSDDAYVLKMPPAEPRPDRA